MKYSNGVKRCDYDEIYDLIILTAYYFALNIWIYCNCATDNNGDILQKCSIVIVRPLLVEIQRFINSLDRCTPMAYI